MATIDDAIPPSYSELSESSRVDQKRYRRRFETRIAATAISICALILLIPSMIVRSDTNRDYGYYSYGRSTGWISPEGYTFLGISIIWNCAEFIVLRRRGRTMKAQWTGIHPGAHVAVDLILWMGLIASGLTKIMIDLNWSLGIGAGAVMILSGALHFTLFVWACVDVDRKKVTEAAKRTVALAMEMQRTREAQARVAQAQFEVPEGMALVPIETLARLREEAAGKSVAPAKSATLVAETQ